jgi:hypothetical protein
MDSILDLIQLRIPPINYVCPPLCEFIFSGSSSGSFVFVDHPSPCKITGLRIEGDILFWDLLTVDTICGDRTCDPRIPALCYNVYHAPLGSETYTVIAECIQGDGGFVIGDLTGCFRVTGITTEGECDLSDPVCRGVIPPPENFFSEVWKSINGADFTLIDTIEGQSAENPALLLGTDSALGDIKLNWDLSDVDNSAGMVATNIWCYKVRNSVPTIGNFSNEACAVRGEIIYLGTAVNLSTWQIIFGDAFSDDSTLLTSLDFSGLRAILSGGSLWIDASFLLASINVDNLILVTGAIQASLTGLPNISLPSLTAVGTDVFFDNTSLQTISAPNLTSIGGGLFCDSSANLVSVDFQSLANVAGNVQLGNCPFLTTVDFSSLIMLNGKQYSFDQCALLAASVEQLLARGVASGITSGEIDLDSGTNAGLSSLSVQGQADYATLVGLGNTVNINP